MPQSTHIYRCADLYLEIFDVILGNILNEDEIKMNKVELVEDEDIKIENLYLEIFDVILGKILNEDKIKMDKVELGDKI